MLTVCLINGVWRVVVAFSWELEGIRELRGLIVGMVERVSLLDSLKGSLATLEIV